MYVHRLEFCFTDQDVLDKLSDMADMCLSALRMNGQICGTEWPLYLENNRCVAIVLAPELCSLDERFNNRYVMERLADAKASGISIIAQPIAEDVDGAQTCSCRQSSGYVLFTSYVSLESPVRCLDCFGVIPLYRFPVMPSGEYYEVIRWQSDYQSCDRLQMNCTVLERQATRQLSDMKSSLSIKGRWCCETLSALAGKPFYYYLYRYHGKSFSAEKKRCCPSCGEPWFMDNPIHSIFRFKCDNCHLLSNLAWNISA